MKTYSMSIITLAFGLFLPTSEINAQKKPPVENQSKQNITNEYVLKQFINGNGINNKEVQMLVVTFPPGSSSPAHRHTCPTFGYVLDGQIKSVFEGKTHLYKKGDSFYEKPFGLHAVTMNPDPLKPARLLVFFIDEKNNSNTESINIK